MRSTILFFLSRALPFRVLLILESIGQIGLGKGWDGGISNEIQILLSLKCSLGLPRIVALDIGANKGDWTSTLKHLDPSSEVHVFEPSAGTFKLLKVNLQELSGVHLYQTAIGKTVGKTKLYSNFETSPLASLSVRRLEHDDVVFSNVEEIDVITLDSWKREHQEVTPNVLKVDVEGHELEVLLGGLSLLPQMKIIQFEFGGTDIDSKVFFQDFWYFFLTKNFKIFRLTPKGLLEIKRYSENEEVFKFATLYAVSCEFSSVNG